MPPALAPDDLPRSGGAPGWLWKSCHLLAGVLLPAVCIVLSFDIGLRPNWQSGRISEFAGYLFSGRTAFAFFPLMLYSMASMVLLLLWRERFVRFFAVRLGVYAGAVLAGAFAVKASVYFVVPFWIMSVALPIALRAILMWTDRAGRWRHKWLLVLPGLWLLGLLIWIAFMGVAALPVITFVAPLASAPYWAFLSYVFFSISVARSTRDAPASARVRAAGAATWGAAYMGAWWLTVHRAVEHYSALPAHPPDCFIATAAARGHVRIVGSMRARLASGGALVANDQLRWLKLAEIALREAAPRVHRACRAAYDLLGPPLARELGHPLLADLAYLVLKPVEWVARAALRLVMPDADELAAKLYA